MMRDVNGSLLIEVIYRGKGVSLSLNLVLDSISKLIGRAGGVLVCTRTYHASALYQAQFFDLQYAVDKYSKKGCSEYYNACVARD
jgi:hypothetical protein